MAGKLFRMFTAERTGLLTVVALLLFVGALSMCSRGGCSSSRVEALPDSALVQLIDSVPRDTVGAIKAKKKATTHKSRKKKSAKASAVERNYYDERVDSGD